MVVDLAQAQQGMPYAPVEAHELMTLDDEPGVNNQALEIIGAEYADVVGLLEPVGRRN